MAELGAMGLELLNGRHFAAFATLNPDGGIHIATVWYLFLDGELYVGTASRSRKVRNLKVRSEASLMVDIRRITEQRGITAIGSATVITGTRSRELNQKIYQKYLSEKALQDVSVMSVFESGDDATIRLEPESWVSWDLRSMYTEVFHGKLSAESGHYLPRD
jgi:general stress protein 26